MIGRLISFEIKHRFRKIMTYIMMFLTAFQAIWYIMGNYENYISDTMLLNSSSLIYLSLAPVGMIVVIIMAIITGTTLNRDLECMTAQNIYSLPINEKKFFTGRFLSAIIINLIIILVFPIGILVMPYLGIGTPDQFGPVPWLQLLHGFFILLIPNIIVITVLSFGSYVLSRRMISAYILMFVIVMLLSITETLSNNSTNIEILMILDPFAYIYTKETVDLIPTALKNTAFLPINWPFIANRIFWLGISFLVFITSYRKFSFKYFLETPTRKNRKDQIRIGNETDMSISNANEIPSTHKTFHAGANLKRFFRLTVMEFKKVIRPAWVKIVMVSLAIMFFLYLILWNPTYYIGHQVPLTSGMTATRLYIGFMIVTLIMVLSSELFFKEHTVNIWQITDTTPTPTWVTPLSKFFAMSGVAFVFCFTFFICGIIAQVGQGFFNIDWGLYVSDLFGFKGGWLTYILFIALTFFIAGLTRNRFATHMLSVAIYMFIILSLDMGLIEQTRFGYGAVPGIEEYSEMNGYGVFAFSSLQYFLMWLSLAVSFVIGGVQLWNRGTDRNLWQRFISRDKPFGWIGTVLSAAFLILFFTQQVSIANNVNKTRNFISDDQEDFESAQYETTYGYVKDLHHPLIVATDVELDLYPYEKTYQYRMDIELSNPYVEPIDMLYIHKDYFTEYVSVRIGENPLNLIEEDEILEMMIYELPEAIEGMESVILTINATKSYAGFSQDDPQADLVDNGLFIERIVPVIGYNDDKELDQNRDRRAYELEPINSRMAEIDDITAINENYFADDAELVTGTIVVSTPEKQTAYAPGILVNQWTEAGRNYFEYQLTTAAPLNWGIGSGNYTVSSETVGNTQVEIFHLADHTYNLDYYLDAAQKGIEYIRSELGEYPYQKTRIVEIPYYNESFHTFANTIAIPEKEGWYADSEDSESLAYIYYSVFRELIRHWVLQNTDLANVQGADMFWTAIPGGLALQLVSEILPEDSEYLIDRITEDYKKGRGNEPNVEPALIYADDIDYLEDYKGALVIYALCEKMGTSEFTRLLNDWIISNENTPLIFVNFYEHLNTQYDPDDKYKQLFEQVEDNFIL